MKGVELLASLFAVLIMIGIGSLLGGLVIFIINTAELPTSQPIDYEMQMHATYPPVKYETMLLSYLESDYEGMQFKKILAYAAYHENLDNLYVDGIRIVDLEKSTKDVFDQWIPNQAYIIELNIDGNGIVIARSSSLIGYRKNDITEVRKLSVPIYIDAEVFDSLSKKTPLPLKVTLDFYVQ
ncbi:MAG: hypothetical protein JW700_02205 [Candidatus Aenigmarchaeota archaeon]|nr:hypothetical protein [Candidatus Aenigmarchaeota archaeon]